MTEPRHMLDDTQAGGDDPVMTMRDAEESKVSALESNLVILDWFMREPRLVDVARDGPRAPSAIRVIAMSNGDPASLRPLSLRTAEPHPAAEGDWIPAGEHGAELLEALAGLPHHGSDPAEVHGANAPEEHAPVSPTAEAATPAPPTAEPSATAAQLQSLSEELHALREELARARAAEQAARGAADEITRERDVLRAKREDLLKQLSGVRERRRGLEAALSSVKDQLAEAEGRIQASQASELNADRLDQLARAAGSIAVREPPSTDDLFVVERLHAAVPEDPRVSQALGILLSRLGRHDESRNVLAPLSRDQLSRTASLALLRSSLAVGSLPHDIGPLVASIRPSADDIRAVAALTSGLASGRVVELTHELLAAVPDEEMVGWLAIVASHLTGRSLSTILSRWADIEPDRALRSLVAALSEERLSTNDADATATALELEWLPLEEAAARDLAQRLASSLSRSRDVPGLYSLLGKIDHLAPADRHSIGSQVIQAIAEIVPDKELIDPAIQVGIAYVEDHRQSNRLSDAIRLAGFVRQNLHRATEETQSLADLILGDLDRAIANSAIGQRVAEEIDRESLGDVRRAVEGKRFLLIGGQRQEWYDDLRRELGMSGDSEWRESSRAEPPSMRQLKDVVKAGKLDGVFVFTDFVSHKTSSIKETARQYEVPCIEAKMSRQGMVEALRAWMKACEGVSGG